MGPAKDRGGGDGAGMTPEERRALDAACDALWLAVIRLHQSEAASRVRLLLLTIGSDWRTAPVRR